MVSVYVWIHSHPTHPLVPMNSIHLTCLRIFLSPPFFGFLSVVLPNCVISHGNSVHEKLVIPAFDSSLCRDPILLFQYDILLLSWIKHKSLFSITDSTKPFFDLPSHIGQKERARGGGTQLHPLVGRSLFSTWRSFGTRGMRWVILGHGGYDEPIMLCVCYVLLCMVRKMLGPQTCEKVEHLGVFSILCSRLSFKKIQCLGQ